MKNKFLLLIVLGIVFLLVVAIVTIKIHEKILTGFILQRVRIGC